MGGTVALRGGGALVGALIARLGLAIPPSIMLRADEVIE